jgi:hypothetical protein
MIQQSVLDSQTSIEAELDQLTCSAYLLTLDLAKALSAVTAAIDGSLEKLTPHSDLQRRTVELSLHQLQGESSIAWDREGLPCDLICHTDLGLACSKRFTFFEEDMNGNPILSLDSGSRVAFVLHHVLGYNIEQSASLVETEERRFRARLRSAYVQLAPEQLMHGAHLTDIREQYAVV